MARAVVQTCKVNRALNGYVRLVVTRELDNPLYARNDEDRCYHCKTDLFEHVERVIVLHQGRKMRGPDLRLVQRASGRSELAQDAGGRFVAGAVRDVLLPLSAPNAHRAEQGPDLLIAHAIDDGERRSSPTHARLHAEFAATAPPLACRRAADAQAP